MQEINLFSSWIINMDCRLYSIPASFLYIACMKSSDVKHDTVPTYMYMYVHLSICTVYIQYMGTKSSLSILDEKH